MSLWRKCWANAVRAAVLVWLALAALGCEGQVPFVVAHVRDKAGEQITEVVSYESEKGLDNSSGTGALHVELQLEREYNPRIIINLKSNRVREDTVRDKIAQLYKLSPNDPEGDELALCPVAIIVPAGTKAKVTVEWTERWAEGVINEGETGQGEQLGSYKVFLGYYEPCSLVRQDNVK
ncbi:MAG: hypothetical protein K6V36_00455 [Anaerolineae bacterium]|nr:hypothetical protein [Anaerolineae bacterium]